VFDNSNSLSADFGTRQLSQFIPAVQAYHQFYLLFPAGDGDYVSLTDQDNVTHIYQYWVNATPQAGAIRFTTNTLDGLVTAINGSGFFNASNSSGNLIATLLSGSASGNGKSGIATGTLATYQNSDTAIGGSNSSSALAIDYSGSNLVAGVSVDTLGQRVHIGTGYDIDTVGSVASGQDVTAAYHLAGQDINDTSGHKIIDLNNKQLIGSDGSTVILDWSQPSIVSALNVVANTTVSIPAGYFIEDVVIQNTTGNAVTGGIKIGTTNGGVDVIVALAVGANSLQTVLDATLLKRIFSMSADQTLYIQTITLWNSASLNMYFMLRKVG
jgi:hypothetical protein